MKNVVRKVMRQVSFGQELRKLIRTLLLIKPRLSLTSQTVRIGVRIIISRTLSSLVIKKGRGGKRNQGGRVNQLPPGYVPTPEEEDENQGFQCDFEF